MQGILRKLIMKFGAVALSVLLIGLMAITAYALTNRRAEQITRPVHRLSQATLLLAKGELNENLPITTDDELGRLTVAFNHMRVNLQRSEAALRRAHDRMAAELEGAESYVQSVLPKPLSSADKGVLTDWTFIASAELGGDSFGYHWLDDEHFAIYLLDVCGHGVGPAMLSISALNVRRAGRSDGKDRIGPGRRMSHATARANTRVGAPSQSSIGRAPKKNSARLPLNASRLATCSAISIPRCRRAQWTGKSKSSGRRS